MKSQRRTIVVATSSLCVLLAAACGESGDAEPEAGTDLEARARAIHASVITIDTHDDISSNFATPESDPGERDGRQVTLPKMREGGLDVAFFIVYVRQTERNEENDAAARARAMSSFEAIHRMTDDLYPDEIEFAYTADDVERIHSAGKLVATIGIENGYSIGRDLSLLETYHELGARYVGITHVGHNDLGDSSLPREENGDEAEEHGGLSVLGEEAVAEANRLGIMVDVSHSGKSTTLDVLRVSRAPVIGSHSAVYALADSPRNLSDEELLALRDNGGVVQIVAFDGYLKIPPPEKTAAREALRDSLGISSGEATDAHIAEYRQAVAELDSEYPGASVADLANHIDYAVDLIGIDHVGISSDFDGGGGIEGWADASETFNVTLELVRRGYSEDEIRKLWGGNLLRVWSDVETVAQEIPAQ